MPTATQPPNRPRIQTLRRRPLPSAAWAFVSVALSVCVALAVPLPCSAEAPPSSASPARPRVGLVLSGGGAKGGAHLGVLKVLRELHVPIDLIVGTSAGAIIGGAYASGMSIDEIEAELRDVHTATLFHDVVRDSQTQRSKDDDAINYIGPEVGITREGLAFPKAAVAGVSLEGVLRRLTIRQRETSFDDLPIPFRAIASDVATSDMVVLDHGSLAMAIRASMALPAIVNPVEIDGRLLVDGGISRNLPVDVARAMGADVIIAVDISTPLYERAAITSLLTVSEQMIRILTAKNVTESLKELRPADILVRPDLATVTTADFDRVLVAEADGEKATRAQAESLSRLSMSEADYARYRSRRLAEPPAPVIVDAIEITGTQIVNPEVVKSALNSQSGQALNPTVVEADMKRLYAMGDFEHVDYRIDERRSGEHVMTVQVSEKSWGPQYLRLGLAMSSDFEGDSAFDLRLTHRRTWLNSLGAEWRNDLQLGRTDLLRSEWYQPLTVAQHVFAAAHFEGRREPFDIYFDGTRIGRYRREQESVGADMGLALGSVGEVRAGLVRGRVRLVTDTGLIPGNLLVPETQIGGLQWRVRADTLDSVRFPRNGFAADAGLFHAMTRLGSAQPYDRLDVSLDGARSLGDHTVRLSAMTIRDVGGRELPPWEVAALGGFLRLSGYRTGELLGSRVTMGRFVYTYRVSGPGWLDGFYLGGSVEVGRVTDGISQDTQQGLVRSHALFVAADTPLGPLYLGMGLTANGRRAAYVYLGLP